VYVIGMSRFTNLRRVLPTSANFLIYFLTNIKKERDSLVTR
jgi:hypothetical protein